LTYKQFVPDAGSIGDVRAGLVSIMQRVQIYCFTAVQIHFSALYNSPQVC